MSIFRRGLTVRGITVTAGVVLVMSVAVPVSATAAPPGTASTAAAGAAAQHAAKPDKSKPPKPPKPKPPKPPQPKPPKGAAPRTDISSTMPRTMRDEITGDFLGKGYGQRMRVEGTNLNVYDSPARGGALLQSTPTDLALLSTVASWAGFSGGQVTPWGPWPPASCGACLPNYDNTFHLNTIYLTRGADALFMTGGKGNTLDPASGGGPSNQVQYQNLLYEVAPDGSCASASCALATVALPFEASNCTGCIQPRMVVVTSLAVGMSGGREYVAVGLSDFGVRIYEIAFTPGGRVLQQTDSFGGMATSEAAQTPPTALAWDPAGSGLLAIGVISPSNEGYFVRVNGNGKVQGSTLVWSQQGGANLGPAPLSAGFGQREDGSPVVAFGMNDSTLRLVDPTLSGPQTDTLATGTGPNAIIAINPFPRQDGTEGGSDYALSYQTGPFNGNGPGIGGSMRWDGTSSGLNPVPVSAGSPNTVTADWDSFRAWYPGIKQGRFTVSNTSGEPVTVALQASPNPGLGCWFAPSWADGPAFPAAGITVPGGQSSPTYYTMGAYTAGAGGGCAATDVTGTWRGYLVITPVNHPADKRLVGLRLNRDMTVDVADQAGGSTTVSITNAHNQLAAYGLWTITVGTPAAPTPAPSPPTVTAARVTPADFTGGPAVYRFDVTGATYQLPTPYPNQLVVPPLLVQGSVNGTSWTTLGTLIPRTEPTITAGPPAQLTLGPATFWWENPAGQPAYQQIRVALGLAGTPSPAVTLASLTAPPDPTYVSGPQIAATSSNGVAAPVDSGLDQAPLSVLVLNTNSQPLPPTDPSYQLIYYRNSTTNTLITNLLLTGANPNSFLGVSPYAGAYPNNGSASSGQPGTFDGFHYLSTTSTIDQHITGFIAGATEPSQSIEVHAAAIDPVNNTTSASTGISLAGCADFTGSNLCRLYPISASQPALYLDTGNGVQLGILTAAPATTSAASLPLQQTAGTTQHLLVSAPLTVTATAATLTDTSAFLPTDHVDTALITHGVLVPLINIPAAGS